MLRRRARPALLVVAVAVAGLGFAGFRLIRPGPSEPPHPKRWDPAVLPLVRFVEDARGLRFRHPVAIAYLSDTDFRREVAAAGGSSTEAPHSEQDDEAAARALGLPVGKQGLVAADTTLSGEEVTAFYDDQTERVEVRGTDLTVGRRATLVHELTHALQDQWFDISRQGTYASDDRNDAFEAVVEGDAVRMENAYVDQLSQEDQDAYDRENAAGDDTAGTGDDDVPDWYSAVTDAPYSLGEPFTEVLDAAGGRSAVDRALKSPPGAMGEIIDAARYRRGDQPEKVAEPAAPSGDRVIRHTDLGELRWLLLLAERIPAADAVRAADGWAGDAYLVYEHRGRVCVKADFAGGGPAAADEMAGALARWARTMPAASDAAVSRPDGLVELASCDPGPAALPARSLAGSQVDEAMKQLTDRATAYAGTVADSQGRSPVPQPAVPPTS